MTGGNDVRKGENMALHSSASGRHAREIQQPLLEDLKVLRRLEGTIDMLDSFEASAPQTRRTMNAMSVRLARVLGQAFGNRKGPAESVNSQ